MLPRILLIILMAFVITSAYLDRTDVFAVDFGLGSTVDLAGRIFGSAYHPEWAIRGSLSYGISPNISLSLRGNNLAQRPQHNTILKAQEGTDQAAYNARLHEWQTGELIPPKTYNASYVQRDISLIGKYHFGVGEIYCPVVELGGGAGYIKQAGPAWEPFVCAGLGHEFFFRPNLALDILGDAHFFPTYKIKPFAVDHDPRNLFLTAITAGLRWYI